jgi:protein arginine N-methyltransferase 1
MRERVSRVATRIVRRIFGFGASRVARSDWLMGAIYDLTNETNFSGLSEHEEMLNDEVRITTYHAGIHANVSEGDVVLDLGTGSGVLAFMASRAGAAKVYAIDHSEFIEVAREVAYNNDITNVEFIHTNSREFMPTEKVDVLLHEQMGDELFNENMLENILDLRDRVLKPGGRILPAHFQLFVEPVVFHDAMRVRRFWNTPLPDGIDLAASERSPVAAAFDTGRTEQLWVRPGSVASTVGSPIPVLEFDLHTLASANDFMASHLIERTAAEDAIVDGFCVWFEARFDSETALTTSPLAPVTSWGNRMFRVDEEVAAGDTLRFQLDLGHLVDASTWSIRRL